MASFAGFRGTEVDEAKRQKLDEMIPMIDLAMVIALHLNIKGPFGHYCRQTRLIRHQNLKPWIWSS